MKQAKTLRWIGGGLLGLVGVMTILSWRCWVRQPPAAAGGMLLSMALLVVAAADLSVAVAFFFWKWQPVCERALKLLWAGRLVNAREGEAITRELASFGLVIMALVASLAVYAFLLTVLGYARPVVIGALLSASAVGLGLFYWHGVQPVAAVFRHVERLARV